MTRAQDGRKHILLLRENRVIYWSPKTDLNWSCSFISAQMKHSAFNQDPTLFLNHSFMAGLTHTSERLLVLLNVYSG